MEEKKYQYQKINSICQIRKLNKSKITVKYERA